MSSKTKKKAKSKAKPVKASTKKAATKAKAKKAEKAAKRTKKARKECHSELVTIKVTPAELDMIFSQADRFAEGNVSRLLRHAARTCKTKAPDLPKKAA